MVQHLIRSVGPAPSRCPPGHSLKHDQVPQQVAMSCTICRGAFFQQELTQSRSESVLRECRNWKWCFISQASRIPTRSKDWNITSDRLTSFLRDLKQTLASDRQMCTQGSCRCVTRTFSSKAGQNHLGGLSASLRCTFFSPRTQETLQPKTKRARARPITVACSNLLTFTGPLPLLMIRELVAASRATVSTTTTSAHAVALATVTEVAVTAAAFVYGVYFSPFANRPKGLVQGKEESSPAAMVFEGVDVTGYRIFRDPEVQKAIAYAKEAHAGQMRKTGEPYITHCIQTARILAALVPSNGKRSVNTVIAGLLHDVIDDTGSDYRDVLNNFGEDVARLVQGVSKLSQINQLLRRHRRMNLPQNSSEDCGLSRADVDSLRVMLLGMVNDPRVVLIKLADRLHNMRTIYALPASKASAVAQETLGVWCSLASRLGVWAVKAELEDLCFAVLQPQTFRQLRAELASMWSPNKDWRHLRRITKRARRRALLYGDLIEQELEKKHDPEDEEELTMQELLEAVVPFDILVDRSRRSCGLGSVENLRNGGKKTKVVRDAEIALAALEACEEILDRELLISTSYIPGMEVTLSSRLKSLYSTHCKMRRKGVGLDQVYDTRALRVVVGDAEGKLHVAAVEGCYNLLSVVHSLWTPVGGEFDDYIVNPKQSGYQSLHTAVRGPDGAPLEVQIRTKGMHEYAEYGHAAHWLYKEGDGAVVPESPPIRVKLTKEVSELDKDVGRHKEHEESRAKHVRVGHPALRVEEGRLLAAVVVRVEDDGKELLVAVSFALHAREAVAAGRSGNQRKRWETYAQLYKKVSDQWWFAPGHGDWSTCLEKYTLCRDGIYHKQDQFDRSLPTFIQLLDLNGQEQVEYMEVMSIVEEGKEVAEDEYHKVEVASGSSCTASRLNNKVRLLRSMLQWEQELRHETATEGSITVFNVKNVEAVALTEVLVILWPDGEIMRMPAGSTASDAALRMGMDSKPVYLNGQIALPNMKLRDGDLMEIRV